jgi:hypothetical protein
MRVAGLAPVQVPTIENVNVTELVPGHMAYRAAMPKLLREVGWMVESDEFAEIEDPDPENHEIRQRELINEIEEARKELEKKAAEKEKKGGKLSWWGKKKKDKKEWEVYDESFTAMPPGHKKLDADGDPAEIAENPVMFDIDAIRKEVAQLAAESKEYNAEAEFEIKEIKSTLPPMKIDIATVSPSPNTPYSTLRETKSYNDSWGVGPSGTSAKLPPGSAIRKEQNGGTGGYEEYNEYDAGEMEMTFDTSFRDTQPSSSSSAAHLDPKSPVPLSPLPTAPSRSGTSSLWEATTPGQTKDTNWNQDTQSSWEDPAPPAERPKLRSAKTEPHPGGSSLDINNNLGHNAWADEFEDDFGKEKEVQMSFM